MVIILIPLFIESPLAHYMKFEMDLYFFYKYIVIHRLDWMSTEPAHHITIASSTRK